MTRKQDSAKAVDWKEVIRGQEDFLRPLIREVLQQVLEAEMDERWVPRRGNGVRTGKATEPATTAGRSSRGLGSWNCACRRTGRADFEPRSSNATSEVKKRW